MRVAPLRRGGRLAGRAVTRRPFHSRMRVAPLKRADRSSGAPARSVFPLSNESGPIEARVTCATPAQTVAFHSRMRVAPLKRLEDVLLPRGIDRFPLSNESGPIEARKSTSHSLFPGKAFHSRMRVAPLKPACAECARIVAEPLSTLE